MSLVLDASVVLAAILAEPGGLEASAFFNGAMISTVNLSEVYRRLIDSEVEMPAAVRLVQKLRLTVVAFDEAQAADAAALRSTTRRIGASFADRACLALALRTGSAVLTADRQWSELDLPIDIRMIR